MLMPSAPSANAAAYLQLTADTAEQLNLQELGRVQSGGAAMPMPPPGTEAGAGCPPGTAWVPEGYGKHGKWRPAGCYRR